MLYEVITACDSRTRPHRRIHDLARALIEQLEVIGLHANSNLLRTDVRHVLLDDLCDDAGTHGATAFADP